MQAGGLFGPRGLGGSGPGTELIYRFGSHSTRFASFRYGEGPIGTLSLDTWGTPSFVGPVYAGANLFDLTIFCLVCLRLSSLI